MKTKKIILITTIIVVILLGAWLVYGMFQGDKNVDSNLENQDNNNLTEEKKNIGETDSKREEIDRQNANYEQAVASSDYNNCLDLEDENVKNSCIARIALNNSDIDLCQKINDSEKISDCKSRVYHKIAIENNNINNCSLIEDDFWHRSCLNKIIIASDYNKSLCDEINDFEDAKACESTVSFNEAVETSNCDLLEGEMKEECKSALNINEDKDYLEEETVSDEDLKNMDSDEDGLSDYDEINVHETDPNNPDTDGDGYLDGEEVENGYSPLGA